ncbi:MAG: hypothetical protein PHY66_11535 [Aliarcobacter sp.]|nr:hypothetical protein [Aliarcobacter sp.]
MSLVSSKSKKVFLCSNMKIGETSKVDIILSPEFYWVRVFDIPVKNITQAKAVIPALFEDILQEVSELSYQVIKSEENKYLCFAYINKKIFEAVKDSGVNLSLVNAIYFAQNECKEFRQFCIDDKSFLYTSDDILVKVPNEVLTQKVVLNDFIENINLSSNKIDIKFYNNFLSSKQIYIVLIICTIIFTINFFKYFAYENEISKLDEKIEKIKISNNLPSSTIQIDSIIKANTTIAQKEINKREALFYLLANNNIDIKDITLQGDVLDINLLNVDKKKTEDYISKKYKIISSTTNNLILNIKVQL